MSKKKRRIKDLEFVDYNGCGDEKWEKYQQDPNLFEYFCPDTNLTYILRKKEKKQ